MVKPKGIRSPGLPGYKTGVNGYTGITVYLTTVSTAKNEISEHVEVNNPTCNPTNTISESVIVSVT